VPTWAQNDVDSGASYREIDRQLRRIAKRKGRLRVEEAKWQGGGHDPENLILICDGHHKLLHDGLLVITGRAPDALTFMRNGKLLVDARSSTELAAGSTLREEAKQAALDSSRTSSARSRFDDVVKIEHVKQALMQLRFKARAARAAAEAACAHVGADADVGTLVKAALDIDRQRCARSGEPVGDERQRSARGGEPGGDGRRAASSASGHASALQSVDQNVADAKQALVQLGYPSTVAAAAVQAARAHVGARCDLASLIYEALRRCTT
jgi:Holliday junction resolvasome RuvABC DNA-binding subunit